MKYQVLGPVAALSDRGEIRLQQQCLLLLAALALQGGRPVPRQELIEIIWDDPFGRDTRLNRIVSELRGCLRPAMPGVSDPVPAVADGYRVEMRALEADVHRFRATVKEAKRLTGGAAMERMSDALGEWSAGDGLYGQPLMGVTGTWADSARQALRMEHRNALLFRLEHLAQEGGHEEVAEECGMLDDNADVLLDEAFVTTWMVTAYRTRGPDIPLWVFRRAQEHWKRSLGRSVSEPLADLARRIEDHDPELADSRAVAFARLDCSSAARPLPLTAITSRAKETTTMSEENDRPIFHNENSTIGAQAKEFHGEVTINLAAASRKDDTERDGGSQQDADGRAS